MGHTIPRTSDGPAEPLAPDVLTTDEVAEMLRVCKRTVERLNLPYKKVGRLRRYRRVDIEEYLQP